MNVTLLPEIKQACPTLRLGHLTAQIIPAPSPEGLSQAIDQALSHYSGLSGEAIRALAPVAAARAAYKRLGKAPSRYRPAAESLLRRAVKGQGLYRINSAVDALNLVSMTTGFSIGGYDATQIDAPITFGCGQPDEPYEGIGRGLLNIAGLPVFRDALGAFGTPTSDSVRTAIGPETRRIWMVMLDFGGDPALEPALAHLAALLTQHAGATNLWMEVAE